MFKETKQLTNKVIDNQAEKRTDGIKKKILQYENNSYCTKTTLKTKTGIAKDVI